MDKKYLTNRQKKALETRKKIYESAEYLFNLKGSDEFNVDDIVKLAKVAKGSFYVHFKSKDEIIALLINDHVKKIDTDYQEYLNSLPPDMPISEVFLAFIGKIADVLTEAIGYEKMRNLYRASLAKDGKSNAVIDYNRELYIMFENLIEKGINEGAFRPDFSPEELAKHFVTAYRGLVFQWCILYPNMDLKEQAIQHFKILLLGISNNVLQADQNFKD
ncbi:MAG: TetR/AcrR family transcriptional regulator [Clostridiales bacterium]|nr:TetR/AcrR family transcriptional regulator [Clostridiales bacterium]